MKINDVNLDINELVSNIYDDKSLLKMRGKGIYLSDNDVVILNRYGINYEKYASIKSLVFAIEDVLNSEQIDELEDLSKRLSEINYYNYTNK